MHNRMITSDIMSAACDAGALAQGLRMFTLTGGSPDTTTLKSIEALPKQNFIRLKQVLCDLDDMGHLNKETLTLALQRVTYKIPSVPESKISKTKHKSRKEIKLDDQSRVFLNPGASRKEDGYGGQSIVNKGYQSTDAVDPSSSVKRFCRSDSSYSLPKAQLAKREAKYLNFFERHAQWYNSNKGPVIVSEWQQGEDMADVKADYNTFSVARRLKWLASGLTDLNKLHAHFRIHADIKPNNFVLDVTKDELHLIDLGSAQKINGTKEFAATPMFVDMKEGKPRKTGSDMFGMGYVVAFLFPELFDLGMEGIKFLAVSPSGNMHMIVHAIPPYKINKSKTAGLNNNEKAVIALLDAMMEPSAENRCTSQQALTFCTNLAALLAVKPEVDDEDLNVLLASSINRNVYETEDALRGCKRPAMFGAVRDVKPVQAAAPAAVLFAPAAKKASLPEVVKMEQKEENSSKISGCVIC